MDQTQHHQTKPVIQKKIFLEEEVRNLSALGDVLRSIRIRLKNEGISIEEARQNFINNYEVQNAK